MTANNDLIIPEITVDVPTSVTVDPDTFQENEDFQKARENLANAANIAAEMLENAAKVTRSSGDPEFYEAFSSILKQTTEVNRAIVEINVMRQKKAQRDNKNPLNQNIFIGSTAELQKLIKGMKED